MNLEEIRGEVEIKVEDPSYGADRLNSLINRCIKYSAAQVSIPSLKRIGTVVTQQGQSWTSLLQVANQETFSGVLKRVKRENGDSPKIYPDIERLMDDYSMDELGEVEAVALEGSNLWYCKMPETTQETLTVLYFVNPSLLVKNEDIPSDFPEHVHWKLFVHGTAYMVFDEIENASEIEGDKVRTKEHYWQSFDTRNPDSGINAMRGWLAKINAHHISSVWDY